VLISVVVPTFNRAAQVCAAVQSVLAQGHAELEVIVVDDGSTDGTADALAAVRERDPRVVYVRQEHAGVAPARNRALDQARGELIAFLDSDDRWQPWKLGFQLACLARTPTVGMIWTELTAIGPGAEVMAGMGLRDILTFRFTLGELFGDVLSLARATELPAELRDRCLYVGDIYARLVLGNLVLPSSVLMTRERLERVGRFDETLEVAGEDFDFFLRVCREGPVAFADVPSVLYQVGEADQLTHPSRTMYMARNYVRTLEHALDRDRERIDLDPELVRRARAHGHTWAAQAYLDAGDLRAARPHLRAAIGLGSPRAIGLGLAAFAPDRVRSRGIALGHAASHRLRAGAGRAIASG
jgi:glycosyltransferase involved in cell wall biosynthesis